MERFIASPNLPVGKVTSVIMGSRFPQIAGALRGAGVKVLELPVNKDIPAPVSAHADMSAYYCGDGELIVSGSIFRTAHLEGLTLRRAESIQTDKYPLDVSLNACETGHFIICRRESTDKMILDHAEKRGKTVISIRQGYAKCSVCVLDEKHIITADSGIAAAVREHGMDALLIEPGFFRLPGYEYGFIGGSCFKIAGNTIAFTVSLSGHPNEKEILKYINNANIDVVYLTKEPCIDVGSILPITEDIEFTER